MTLQLKIILIILTFYIIPWNYSVVFLKHGNQKIDVYQFLIKSNIMEIKLKVRLNLNLLSD